jgi:hypothetical protein
MGRPGDRHGAEERVRPARRIERLTTRLSCPELPSRCIGGATTGRADSTAVRLVPQELRRVCELFSGSELLRRVLPRAGAA